MPRRAFLADVELLSSQAASGKLPRVKKVTFDSNNDVISVEFDDPGRSEPIVLDILCGDIDTYPKSRRYFLSLEHAPSGYNQILEQIQEPTSCQTLSELVGRVDKAFVCLQEQSRTGISPHEDDAIIIHSSDSEDGGITIVTGHKGTSTGKATSRKSKNLALPGLDIVQDECETYILDYSSSDDLPSSQRLTLADSRRSRRKSRNTASSGTRQKWSPAQAESILDGTIDELPVDGDAEESCTAYYKSIGKPDPLQVRIGKDLRDVRQHGYYFGVLAGMSEASTENLLAVSIRTSDLSLSPEMLMAWDLDPDVFIVLLIRLRSCYMAYETLINAPRSSIDLSFRIGKCENYKPSVEDALSSFGSLAATAKGGKSNVTSTFTKILISTSLSRFMDDYFLTLAGYKEDYGCSWTDAVNDVINRTMTSGNKGPTQTLPNQRSSASIYKKSFPLLAMQFAMDQLKNCTEYCQACHARLAKSHRSLKPTVCSRDLCLYQHISLGMGRSVEYEILCQPNVVDLLINFCYTALRASNSNATDPIRSYPTNLPLKVPDWQNGLKGIYSNKAFDRPSFVLPTHPPGASSAPISQFVPGQWVTIYMGSLASHSNAHTLIGSNDVVLPSSRTAGPLPKTVLTDVHGGQITFRHAVISSVNHANSTVYLEHFEAGYTTAGDVSAEIFRYTKDFDDLEQRLKAAHLLLLLDTLPPVQHLKSELEKPTVNDLKSARGVSPAAAVLLGWIMATNRSCILQITEPSLMIHELLENRRMAPPNGYLQFCFLQGVPEADHEFQRQLEANTKHTNNYPTLLAWHGSSTVNWHSILRTGLDYTIMANGRAYGDGVYFSPDFNTSLGYATNLGTQWPKAVFDLRSVVSLYEVINAPHKFKSSAPHYVIDQKHWSRCRFLFVRQENMQGTDHANPSLIQSLQAQQAQQAQQTPYLPSSQQVRAFISQLTMPQQTIQLPNMQTLHQSQRHTVVTIGGQQMRVNVTNLPQPPQMPQQIDNTIRAARQPQTIKSTASQRAVARDNTGTGRFFEQDPSRPANGPYRNRIYVPLVSMPGMHRQGTDEELVYKRPRGAFDRGSEVMDESDKAFLPKDTTKEAASATRLGSTAVTAIIIDLDSDEDGGGISEAKPVAVASTALHAPQGSRASSTLMKSGVTPYDPGKLDYTTLPQLPTPSWCTSQAQRALAREIDRMQKVQANTPLSELGWYIDFSRLDNMFQWIVELHSFDRTLPLAKDMMSLGVASIVCELRFGADYPMSPPLVRVIRPRFTPFLQGGGGNVTAGGAMCMELLTSTGWSPANQTDAVLLQVRLALCATDRPARLDRQHYMGEYGVGEAFAAYNRAAQTHGWAVPSDMQKRMHF